MNDSVQGLILKQLDYRYYDVIITVLTKEYGKIAFRVSGARKMTSRNAGSILPYTLGEFAFDYKDGQTMFRLKTARTKKLYRHLHEDLELSSAAGVLAEVTDRMTLNGLEDVNREETYALLAKAFDLLEEGKDPVTVLALYISELMDLFGIAPDVDECVHDGSTQVSAISAEEGGFLCESCARLRGVPLSSVTDLRRFRLLVKGGLEHFDIIEQAGGAEKKDLRILIRMIEMHAGLVLKSYSLFDRLFSH